MIRAALIAFVAGAAHEALCVGWVHYSERGRATTTSFFSMAAATAEVTGILDSVHNWHVAPAFIIGYGVGTYVAVRVKSRQKAGKISQ